MSKCNAKPNCGDLLPRTVIVSAGDENYFLKAKEGSENAVVAAIRADGFGEVEVHAYPDIPMGIPEQPLPERKPGALIVGSDQLGYHSVEIDPSKEDAFMAAINGDAKLEAQRDMVVCPATDLAQ
jgi:hypothetical protein